MAAAVAVATAAAGEDVEQSNYFVLRPYGHNLAENGCGREVKTLK